MKLAKMVATMRYHHHANMVELINVGNQLGIISDEKAEAKNRDHVMVIFNDILPRLGVDTSKLVEDEQ